MTFNNEQTQIIIDLYNQGMAYKKIAERLGTSKTTIFRYIQSLKEEGIIVINRTTSRSIIHEQNEKIINWYNQGLSYKEIAKRLGISVSKVESRITTLKKKGVIKNLHHPRTKKDELANQYRKISLWHSQGVSTEEMAERLGIPSYTVKNRITSLRKNGIITANNKSGKKKNSINAILELEKSIAKNQYPKNEVHTLVSLYIKEGLYKDAVVLLDYYCEYNILSDEELSLIYQIRAKLQARILQTLREEEER